MGVLWQLTFMAGEGKWILVYLGLGLLSAWTISSHHYATTERCALEKDVTGVHSHTLLSLTLAILQDVQTGMSFVNLKTC